MTNIWKIELLTTDEQMIQLPFGAEFLTVQTQCDKPCMCALVDTDEPLVSIKILMYETGMEVPDNTRYIGTFQMPNGNKTFHVFEGEV